jgi:hypothetical protein
MSQASTVIAQRYSLALATKAHVDNLSGAVRVEAAASHILRQRLVAVEQCVSQSRKEYIKLRSDGEHYSEEARRIGPSLEQWEERLTAATTETEGLRAKVHEVRYLCLCWVGGGVPLSWGWITHTFLQLAGEFSSPQPHNAQITQK